MLVQDSQRMGHVVFVWEHSPGKYRVSEQYEQLPEEHQRNILTDNSKVTAFMMTKQGIKRGKYRELFKLYDDETMTNPPKERKYKGVIIKKVEDGLECRSLRQDATYMS